ncbi:hypothetical protein PtB15_3B434 [Puccinia triticina]|nr:hypothetical protein PtB15_3B434 [Puccinia triticina]
MSSPAKAVSDYGHPPSSSPVKNFNRPHQQRSGAPSLISQIPDRHAASPIPPSPAGFPANSGLYAKHDILMPPRPAFYGSRMSVRSISLEQSPSRQSYAGPRISATLNCASTGAPAGLYNNPRTSLSNASKSQGQDPRHLDQWHSDDDDNPKPASAKPVRDEDEDEDKVTLLKLQWHSNDDDDPKPASAKPVRDEDKDEDGVPLSKLKKNSSPPSAAPRPSPSGLLVDSAEVSTDWEWESRRPSTGKQPRQLELGGLWVGVGVVELPCYSKRLVPSRPDPHSSPPSSCFCAAGRAGLSHARPARIISFYSTSWVLVRFPCSARSGGQRGRVPTPVGVDPYLYAGLDTAQKIALHQRSQLILQVE